LVTLSVLYFPQRLKVRGESNRQQNETINESNCGVAGASGVGGGGDDSSMFSFQKNSNKDYEMSAIQELKIINLILKSIKVTT
jgi:hypothetical protein